MGKVLFRSPQRISSWRKIALGTWRAANDPSVYGVLKIDMTQIEARRALMKKSGASSVPTLTAIIGRASALVLARYPQLNGMIRFGGISLRTNVDLFFQAAVDEEGAELSGIRIAAGETKTVFEIMAEISAKGAKVRAGTDEELVRTKQIFSEVPAFCIGWILTFTSFLLYTLNLDLSKFGIPRDPFGSIMITNIGNLGVDHAFGPLVPYSRVPLLLAVGAVNQEPVVREGLVTVASICNIGITFDHRFIDGVYGAKMMKLFRYHLETKEGLDELGLVS